MKVWEAILRIRLLLPRACMPATEGMSITERELGTVAGKKKQRKGHTGKDSVDSKSL
ncbi:MAG: hypothetical protein V8Q57_03840 [Blautia sp.]